MGRSKCRLWVLALLPGISFAQPWLAYDGHGENADYHIVLLSGDQEYRSEEALPQLARILSASHGFRATVLFTQRADNLGFVNPVAPVEIPGLHHLSGAHLMVIFTRFIALPDGQMRLIDDYLRAGKPVIGIRTATSGRYAVKRSTKRRYLFVLSVTAAVGAYQTVATAVHHTPQPNIVLILAVGRGCGAGARSPRDSTTSPCCPRWLNAPSI